MCKGAKRSLTKQPHHPGVWHVVVLVKLRLVEVLLLLLFDVPPSEPLLLKYFQLKQSTQGSSSVESGTHSGTSSYASITFAIT